MGEKKYIEREAVLALQTDLHFDNIEQLKHWRCHHIDPIEVLLIPVAAVRPVVTCAECKWWTKQEASLQGRCELLQMYPTGAWFCANGKREES